MRFAKVVLDGYASTDPETLKISQLRGGLAEALRWTTSAVKNFDVSWLSDASFVEHMRLLGK